MRRRITLTIVTGISVMLLIFAVVSTVIVRETIEGSLNRKLSFAHLIRSNIDSIIKDNVNRLYDISISGKVDLRDSDLRPEREAVKTAYRYSLFTDGVFLLDQTGTVLVHYPDRVRENALNVLSIEPISRTLAQGKPVVSDVYTLPSSRKKVLFVLVPLKDKRGAFVGAAGGEIDPTNPLLTQRLGLIDMGPMTFIDIVDSNGVVIASSIPAHTLTQCNRDQFFTTLVRARKERVTTCHHCHAGSDRKGAQKRVDMALAFVPLEMAPWGVSIQESRDALFSPARKLMWTFAMLGVIFIGTAFLLTIGISRSIVSPINELSRCAQRITRGDLSRSIELEGNDEISALGSSFEAMRSKLVESMESIRRHTHLLEDRVRERTHQIKESQNRAELLLKKAITSQEDERKRIARGLHDTMLQDLSAALMRIDICKMQPDRTTPEDIERLRQIVLNAYEGVIGIMQNLRPTLLDDLGLSSAVKSFMGSQLEEKGLNYFMHARGDVDKRLRQTSAITLYRIIQEAVLNAARHAKAESVFVLLECKDDVITVEIEDDGEGFSVQSINQTPAGESKDRRGLGLMGMKERAMLIGGTLEICSQIGIGTRIQVKVRLTATEVMHA